MVIVIEKICISVVMVYLIAQFIIFLVVLRERWHKGSQAKYKAKKAKIEARYLEYKLKCGEMLTNEPNQKKGKIYCIVLAI